MIKNPTMPNALRHPLGTILSIYIIKSNCLSFSLMINFCFHIVCTKWPILLFVVILQNLQAILQNLQVILQHFEVIFQHRTITITGKLTYLVLLVQCINSFKRMFLDLNLLTNVSCDQSSHWADDQLKAPLWTHTWINLNESFTYFSV